MRHTLLYISILYLITACSPKTQEGNSILDLVPANASVVLKINDFESLKNDIATNEILNGLETSELYSKISKKIRPMGFLNGQHKGVLALSAMDSVKFDFTYISTDSISFVDWNSKTDTTIESLNHNNSRILKYEIDEALFYTTYIDQYGVLSSSKTILENLIATTDQEIINTCLEQFYTVSDSEKVLNIWIDIEQEGALLKQILSMDKSLSNFASCTSLDLNISDTEILLNGITVTTTEKNHFLNLFNNTKPTLNTVTALIPGDAHYLKSYTLNDFKLFSKNKAANNLSVSAIDSLLDTVEEVGMTEIGNDNVLFLRTYGTATLLDYLNEQKLTTEEYGGNEIWELKKNAAIFGSIEPLTRDSSYRFAGIIENTFLFTQNKNTLQLLLNKYKSGDIFNKTNLFKSTDYHLTSSSSVLTLSNLEGTTEILEKSGSPTLAKTIADSGLSDYAFGSQFIADDGFFHSTFLIKKIAEEVEKNTVASAFEVQFNTDLASLPQFVTNHNNRKKEILVQDQENILYLISNSGKILWKKQLEGTIQGKVHQVDIYKNGKLQLAFTTNNEFLILDRNGKEVAPFTMKFSGGNLNPLAVFDYEGKKDYRFLVTQNEKIFMYNKKGKIVKGFKYNNAEATILEAPQHFRIGTKDYLTFKLENGQLKILNRVGDTRVAVKDKFKFSDNTIKLYQNKFTLSSTDGILYQIDTKGVITRNNLNLTKDHGFDATSKTLAIMNDNILRIRDKKVELELGVYSKPTIFYLNDKIYISVTDIQNQKIYLFDSQAKPIPNFPIFGASSIDMTDMDNNKKPDLVLKDQENSIKVFNIR